MPVPGCHDALSAKVIASCDFEALQISGLGVAGSLFGKPDVGLVQTKDVLDSAWNISQAVDIPVMADIDTGGGNAINAAWMTERLIDMGIAGMNIEDQAFPKRCGHLDGKEVIDSAEMNGKIRACAAVRDFKDGDFVINARTDSFATHGIDEAIGRCRQYLEAGADMVFIDAIASRKDIEHAVVNVGGLLSVNLMDGVTGVRTELIPIPELAKMGVARFRSRSLRCWLPIGRSRIFSRSCTHRIQERCRKEPTFCPRSTTTNSLSVLMNTGSWSRNIFHRIDSRSGINNSWINRAAMMIITGSLAIDLAPLIP